MRYYSTNENCECCKNENHLYWYSRSGCGFGGGVGGKPIINKVLMKLHYLLLLSVNHCVQKYGKTSPPTS